MANKKISSIFIPVLMIAILACVPLVQSGENKNPDSSETLSVTLFPTNIEQKTKRSDETSTLPILLTATVSDSLMIPTADASVQTYVDPEGWYQVQFPVDLLFDRESGQYRSGYRFFESGYLPDYGIMSKATNVCAWLVNVEEKEPQNYSINWLPNGDASCSIASKPDQSRQTRMEIYENPGADAAHRFIYTKIGWSSSEGSPDNGFRIRFNRLQAVPQGGFVNYEISFEGEPSGWEDLGSALSIISIKEYPLMPGVTPYGNTLLQLIPDEARPEWAREGYVSTKTEEPPGHELTLEDLGYELRDETIFMDGREILGQRLYRDDRLLLDAVWDVSKIYTVESDTQTFTTFVVKAWKTQTRTEEAYIIQNDAIRSWPSSIQDPRSGPVEYQDSLLWLKITDDWNQVEVLKTNPQTIESIYSLTLFTEGVYASDKFVAWNDHWVWVDKDFLIQDGVIVNNAIGVQEIFSWKAIEDREVFLFRKDGRTGLFYDGKVAALPYQDVTRHLCCGLVVNNPILTDHEARFFAVREGVWYYVIIVY